MKCIIPGPNVKVFGRAIHSLSKIGDELYLEPLEQGLAVRTVNSTRSAYAYILFSPSYFSHYDDGSSITKQDEGDNDDDDSLRCKVNIKSILTVFRSLSWIEKNVERCKISLNVNDARLVFHLYCKHGHIKTHNLSYIECETLQAVFSKDLTPNKLTAHPKLLCDAVVNFQNNQEEVTLIAKPDKISLKNYVDDEPDPKKVVLTEMHLNPKEFDNCQLGVDTEITFCLKELRAILGFAEVLSLPINIHFERSGRPVVISINSDVTFEANFVLATLASPESSSSQSKTSSKHKSQKLQKTQEFQTNHTAANNEFEDDFEEMIYNDPTVEQLTSMVTQSANTSTSSSNSRNKQSNGLAKNVSDHSDLSLMNTSKSRTLSDHLHVPSETNGESQSLSQQSGSPVIPFQNNESIKSNVSALRLDISEMQTVEEEEEEDDVIAGTPPSKKFRSMIFGTSQSSTQQSQTDQQTVNVLAEDTDEED